MLQPVIDKRITQGVAASMLNLSERHLRRLVRSVREFGDGGIIHRGRGRPSNRRLPEKIKAKVLKLFRKNYRDFGPTLASEKLLEIDGIGVNRETLRQWLMAAGLWERRRKRRSHRQWRLRRECFGQDGSD